MSNHINRARNCQQYVEIPIPTIASMLLVILIIVSLTPAGVLWFESSMARHMLVQLPLLIVMGAICFPPKIQLKALLTKIDPHGAMAFICFTAWMFFWMLPLNLDLATIDPTIRLLKLISVPFGIGFSLRCLWHQTNAVLKCVVIFEVWASITRLGWLYMESPLPLCSSYLIGEQQLVGTLLLIVSAISATVLVSYALFGSFGKNTNGKLVHSLRRKP